MNEEKLNMSIRKFLKNVGITSQREIEKAINTAIETGKISGNETIPVNMSLNIENLDLNLVIEGEINLE